MEEKSRQIEPSPRDVVRFMPEVKDSSSSGGFRGTSPRSWDWKEGVLKIPQRGTEANNYKSLKVQDEEEQSDKNEDLGEDRIKRRFSFAQQNFCDEWIESVESGELDVYTCLGLSNSFTWTPDTQKLIAKVAAVTTLQIAIPCIMLYLEFQVGMTIYPAEKGKGFRIIGSALYLYSVYSMYNNALDECRSRLLNFAFRYKLPPGYWMPLLLGEFSNVLVSIVLVITLYVIYTDLTVPADLILNAVAVNFLGSVDAEFVNPDMKKDALRNFKELSTAVLENPDVANDDDEDVDDRTIVDRIVGAFLYAVAFCGCMAAMMFFILPSKERELDDSGCGNVAGKR